MFVFNTSGFSNLVDLGITLKNLFLDVQEEGEYPFNTSFFITSIKTKPSQKWIFYDNGYVLTGRISLFDSIIDVDITSHDSELCNWLDYDFVYEPSKFAKASLDPFRDETENFEENGEVYRTVVDDIIDSQILDVIRQTQIKLSDVEYPEMISVNDISSFKSLDLVIIVDGIPVKDESDPNDYESTTESAPDNHLTVNSKLDIQLINENIKEMVFSRRQAMEFLIIRNGRGLNGTVEIPDMSIKKYPLTYDDDVRLGTVSRVQRQRRNLTKNMLATLPVITGYESIRMRIFKNHKQRYQNIGKFSDYKMRLSKKSSFFGFMNS